MNTDANKYNNDEVIDLRVQFVKLWKRKTLFIKVWVVTFALACIYILPQPRTYTVDLALAPEMGGASATGTLSSIASSFGFNLGNAEISDAFYPELYPDLLSTNKFIVDLLYTRVQTADAAVDTTYLNYILRHHRKNPYIKPYSWCRAQINKLFEEDAPPISHTKRMNPHRLTRREDAIVNKVRKSIQCDVDIKTNVITIVVKDQDPLVCAIIADSVRVKLQDFITAYRTNKSRIDEQYYKSLADSARIEYETISRQYSQFCDAHKNIVLQSYLSERDRLENELQTSMSTYNAMQAQYLAAKAKVQEQTPAFTILRAPSVPVKPNGPKRMIFVAAMLFLSTIGTCIYIFRKELVSQFVGSVQN